MPYYIKISKTTSSRIKQLDFNNIPFGRIFSDHMFVADYFNEDWHNCRIVPLDKISIHPATTALHYGQSVFEGMKAYKNMEGAPQLFRPMDNIKRMNRSAKRMAMAEIPEELFLNALTELIALDQNWIPTNHGSALYVRPLMFATDEYIGIKASDNYKFIIITCPVGAYYPKPVKVYIEDKYVRAFPGGVGSAKAAGNYAATLYAVNEAKKKGYDQILWMDGVNFEFAQEIGTMNVFFIIDGKVITPPVETGTILDGITRNSAIQLLNQKGIEVEEREIGLKEIFAAYESEKLEDVFGTGTAATVSHISDLGYKGENYQLPPVESRKISNALKQDLEDIKTSKAPDPFNWVYKVTSEAEVAVEDETIDS